MIKVNFFAALREQLNCSSTDIQITQAITVASAKQQIIEQHPEWAQVLTNESLLTAVNHDIVDDSFMLNSGDELAFFPPVTGG